MPNALLQKYLKKRISQPTVILCFRILLENAIKNGLDVGMRKSEIAKIFNIKNKQFGIQNFKTDYILRQTGIGHEGAIIEKEDVFFIDKDFITDLSEDDLLDVINQIDQKYLGLTEIRKILYKEIEDAKALSVDKKIAFILNMLMEKETERKGQCFEVTAFAILKVFYSIRGFELNRFSTIYSNDGGIDYTSQTSIYQVTTFLSDTKFEDDLKKAPLKKRIFVFKKAITGFDFRKMEDDLVSDYISADDLKNHLDYMLSKKPEANSTMVLDVILEEFEREHYL